jgi:hypothetical protein
MTGCTYVPTMGVIYKFAFLEYSLDKFKFIGFGIHTRWIKFLNIDQIF